MINISPSVRLGQQAWDYFKYSSHTITSEICHFCLESGKIVDLKMLDLQKKSAMKLV
jgi:hypothetical protein